MEFKNGFKYDEDSFLLPENGIRLDDVISSLVFFDCFNPDFWIYVNSFFGDDILKDDEINKKITTVLKKLFWFGTSNGVDFDTVTEVTCLSYFVDIDKNETKWLKIVHCNNILWDLKLCQH